MIKKRVKQYLFLLTLGMSSTLIHSMVMDNRYMPLYPHLYNGSDYAHKSIFADLFAITGNQAINPGQINQNVQSSSDPNKANEISTFATRTSDGKIIGIPELQGTLDLYELGGALKKLGLANPIPSDWQFLAPFTTVTWGKIEGQGIAFQGYVPFCSCVAVGGSLFVLNLSSYVTVNATNQLQDRLLISSQPSQEYRFNTMMTQFQEEIGISTGSYQVSGVSDIELYLSAFKTFEYSYKCKKLDISGRLGLLIPTGVLSTLQNVGSVPFGGDGHWGWYLGTQIECELKDDWKAGVLARIQKRLPKTSDQRIPINGEPNTFAPLVGQVRTIPGTTFIISPYFSIQDLREGLGACGKFTFVYHEYDTFEDKRVNPQFPLPLLQWYNNTEWLAEYGTVDIYYDVAYKKPNWKYAPTIHFTWDIPTNFLSGRGFAKTNRVMLGINFNF